MITQQETSNDYNKVYKLIKEAVVSSKHIAGNEQDLLVTLKKARPFFLNYH